MTHSQKTPIKNEALQKFHEESVTHRRKIKTEKEALNKAVFSEDTDIIFTIIASFACKSEQLLVQADDAIDSLIKNSSVSGEVNELPELENKTKAMGEDNHQDF